MQRANKNPSQKANFSHPHSQSIFPYNTTQQKTLLRRGLNTQKAHRSPPTDAWLLCASLLCCAVLSYFASPQLRDLHCSSHRALAKHNCRLGSVREDPFQDNLQSTRTQPPPTNFQSYLVHVKLQFRTQSHPRPLSSSLRSTLGFFSYVHHAGFAIIA